MSIITVLNVHKDEYNHIGAVRFTEETGQELIAFYSKDRMSASEDDARQPQNRGLQSNLTSISAWLRGLLWAAVPSANDKHLPPVLYLCKGMPVIIRLNTATKLCITKGQESIMDDWKDVISSHRKQIFDVLFISLTNPPFEVCIPSLPLNVVPVIRKVIAILCSLPDDTMVRISRSQVHVLPNFMMTDFSLQGKTRAFNPVDLNNCHTH